MIRGEWKPGIMHAAIFLGFLILLFRKLELIAIGYDEAATWPGIAGLVFAGVKDLVELGVLAACGYALYRRLVQKPKRLERTGSACHPVADRRDHGHRLRVRRSVQRGSPPPIHSPPTQRDRRRRPWRRS
jgi:hypothetical protein